MGALQETWHLAKKEAVSIVPGAYVHVDSKVPWSIRVIIPFGYWPRTRPHRPILPNPCFFSSVKTSPEEWYQAVTCLKTKPNVEVDPIHCHVGSQQTTDLSLS